MIGRPRDHIPGKTSMTIDHAEHVLPREPAADPGSPLVLVEHVPDLLGEAHGFGGFLFDRHGRVIVEDGAVWLYTTRLAADGWDSWVRRLDLATLKAGPARRVLVPDPGHDRAVLHHVVRVADGLVVGFYCDGLGFSAAIADAPEARFVRAPGFAVRPEPGWETRGESADAWSLECNGAYVLIADGPDSLDFWQGYDSYRRDGRLGDLGWIRIRIDKVARNVRALERHPENPLAFRETDWACVRCGGNLSSDVTIGGRRAFFYYLRPDHARFFIGMALSTDPLFLGDAAHHVIGGALAEEEVAEKFEALADGDDLLLFYESRHSDGSWRTGLRRFRRRH